MSKRKPWDVIVEFNGKSYPLTWAQCVRIQAVIDFPLMEQPDA